VTIYEFLNQKPNQYLYLSDDRFYAYGGLLLNYHTGEVITLNDEETLAKQLGVTKYPLIIKDGNKNQIYYERSRGFWSKRKHDANGNETKYQNSDGYWEKAEYDANGNKTRYEDSEGYWAKWEYDTNGNVIYTENSW
jgi:YD repeat-containing protein